MYITRLKQNQAGDTMVEVLIALSIIAMVLGASYALVSNSLKTSLSAQERTEASSIGQSLIEIARVYAQSDHASMRPLTTADWCFSRRVVDIKPTPPTLPTPPVSFTADPTHPFCNQGFYRFHVVVTRLPLGPSGLEEYEYAAFVDWESPNAGFDQVVIRYKHVRIPPTP